MVVLTLMRGLLSPYLSVFTGFLRTSKLDVGIAVPRFDLPLQV